MTTMQRRHYEAIAEIIRDWPINVGHAHPMDDKTSLAHHFSRRLQSTNTGFKPSRFLRACGVEE